MSGCQAAFSDDVSEKGVQEFRFILEERALMIQKKPCSSEGGEKDWLIHPTLKLKKKKTVVINKYTQHKIDHLSCF